ncbi:hypothetical protein [Singulisphaera sp. PoT]|uniref:hypothetical protein n=1 Tax=Singulisphaera sp. PoT TaxID=3411797 RepID=UPI003BF53766
MKRMTHALVLAMMAVTGCTLNKTDLRTANFVSKIGNGGQLIEPKRCALKIAILARPVHDKVIDQGLWSVVDEQVVPHELHKALETNGLRVGLLSGELPAEVETLLNKPINPGQGKPVQYINIPDGDQTMISTGEAVPQVSLLLNRDGNAAGKDYQDASGWLRTTVNYEGENSVSVRILPEIHHGPITRGFSAMPNTGEFSPRQFVQKDGQQEDALRELATTLNLKPGQVAVLGCDGSRKRSLGSFLFTETEANSDRLLQRVVLIWATRSTTVNPGTGTMVPQNLEPIEPPKS